MPWKGVASLSGAGRKKGRLPFPVVSPAEFLDELLPELLKRD